MTSVESRLERQLRGRPPAWEGAFAGLLYEVPETHRAFRDRLRREALLVGYGILRPGLLISASDRRAELAGALDRPPPGAQVIGCRVELPVEDSARVAAQVWALDALAKRYRVAVAAAGAAIDRAPARLPMGPDALSVMAAALQPVYAVAADDPDLPGELLPPDWPGDQLGHTVHAVLQALGPAVRAYLESLAKELC